MEKQLFEIICAKDEQSAKTASQKLIQTCDIEEFEKLCEKMNFLFDFVKDNVCRRLSQAVNKENFKNIIKFFGVYSPYFDDLFSSILAKYADEDLTDEILELLSTGNEYQKTYCAGYFKKIPDTVAVEDLINNLSTQFEPLFINCASALGKMREESSYKKYLANLENDDVFIKLQAVKFLIAYGNNDCFDSIFKVMENSGMAENIAGEIAEMISPYELLKTDFSKGTILFNNILNGLGEILPLDNIFYYEIYEICKFLLNANDTPQKALLLLNMKLKFDTFTQNEEYIFDLDKNTKNEIFEVKNLLFSENSNFWNIQKSNIKPLIKAEEPLLSTALEIIKEEKISELVPEILALINAGNETVVCEAAAVLKDLGELGKIDKTKICLKNENLKAIFENMFV